MRFSILSLMVMVAVLALGLGAMVSRSPYLALGFLSLLGLVMLFAPVWALYGEGTARRFAGGFAIVAWLYVSSSYFLGVIGGVPGPYLLVNYFLRSYGGMFGEKANSVAGSLGAERAITVSIFPELGDTPVGLSKAEWDRVIATGHGMAVITLAGIGGGLAMYLASARERTGAKTLAVSASVKEQPNG